MALFPDVGPQYLDEKSRDIKQRMEAFYADSISINQSFWQEADIDTRFHAGDQTLWDSMGYGNLPATRRRQFNFNRIRRVVNMISGQQRRTRKSTIVVPIENSDAVTADQLTKILMWGFQRENVLETISESFEGALVTGMNLLQVWVDYRNDPISGDIKVDNCSYNNFLIDPFFRKADLSDCNALWKRSYLTRREIISLLPDKRDELIEIPGQYTRDDKFAFMPETYGYAQKNLLAYDEFYYRTYRTQKLLADTQTGETLEWKSPDEDRLKLYLQTYPPVTMIETEIPTVNVAIVVQGKVMYDGPNPLGIDRYPFIPVFGYYQPQMPYFPWRIQGIVRGLRDSQYLYNRRKVIELDILESQINSGWIYKENALVNPKDVFNQVGQGKGIALKDEAQMTDVQQIQSPQIPPSTLQLSQLLGEEINQLAGVSETQVGGEADDKSGFMMALRQNASIAGLQGLFDGLDRSQKLLSEIWLAVAQANFTPGKIQRITEEQPTPQFYNKAFGKYDCTIEDGLNTTTQRQMHFAQLLTLREAGVAIPTETLLDACTLQDKKKLLDQIKKQEEQQQQQQQIQLEAAIKEQEARTALAHSRAVADQGLGLERLSRIQENKAMAIERQSAAVKDENLALLNLVKALKEIDTIDIEHIEKMLAMQNMIKQQEQTVATETNAQNNQPKGVQ